MLLLLLCVGLVIGISFLCSLTEACLLSLSLADIAQLADKKPYAAEQMRRLRETIERPIAAILIVNNLANIVGAALAGVLFADLFGHKWVGVFSFFLALAIIQWSEYLPKTLGVLYKRSLAAVVALPLTLITRGLGPLVFLLDRVSLPFQGRNRRKIAPDALNEIVVLTRFASFNNLISREQLDIVARSIKLSGALVRDIMVAREEIKFLSAGMSMADALVEAHIHHHTRYLLIEGQDLDRVLGFVNVKDIVSALQINPADPSLKGIMRPAPVVRDSQPAPQLLNIMTKGYQHMAVVKNDAGRTVGLVTLEDVVEAIVGNIDDEYDRLPAYVYRIAEGRFLAGGGISLAALKEQTGLEVPEPALCLHDWLGTLTSAAPAIEQKIGYQNLVFTIRKLRRSKIHEVIVDKRSPAESPLNVGKSRGAAAG